jgi:hypothetical protein
MKKKLVLVLLMVVLLAGGAFAQEENIHQPRDVLIGLNFGLGITPNMFEPFRNMGEISQRNYAIICDFGITVDFYRFNWLSVNTGLLLHPDIYALDQDSSNDYIYSDAEPLCLTIPIAAHVNIPKAEWLYVGIGLSLNIPLFGMFDYTRNSSGNRGEFFLGLPIDFGFDFIKSGNGFDLTKPGGGGARFFFRITPEFHERGTTVPIGFIWQIWNWKVR